LAALVRQESLFSPTAASSADARGLTQVIPSTAQAIASALGVSDFRLEDLYRPKLSLQFGAYYLAEMLRLAGGDTWMALASYNGGYGNAVRWAGGDRPIDPDLFLENVTFDETRTYLQSVARNYRFYRALYSTTP
jgi:soluble lytic murein transglycosylase